MKVMFDGKAEYAKSSAQDKLNSIKAMGKLDTTHSNYQEFERAIKNREPFCVYSVGTTGLKEDDELTQIGISSYMYDGDKYNLNEKIECIFRASDEIISRAKQNKGYDVFKHGGFDRPVEQNGLGIAFEKYLKIPKGYAYPNNGRNMLKTETGCIAEINQFMGKHKDEMFLTSNPEFAVPFLQRRGLESAEFTYDINDIIREFDDIAFEKDDIQKALNMSDSKYGLADIASQYSGKWNNDDKNLYSCANKNDAIFGVVSIISEKEQLLTKSVSNENIACYTDTTKSDTTSKEKTKEVRKDTKKKSPSLNFRGKKVSLTDETPMTKQELVEKERELASREALLESILDKVVSVFCAVEAISKQNSELVTEVKKMAEKMEQIYPDGNDTREGEEHDER